MAKVSGCTRILALPVLGAKREARLSFSLAQTFTSGTKERSSPFVFFRSLQGRNAGSGQPHRAAFSTARRPSEGGPKKKTPAILFRPAGVNAWAREKRLGYGRARFNRKHSEMEESLFLPASIFTGDPLWTAARPCVKMAVMLKSGILNPNINSLLSRVRHTNTLVIADRGFPFWPEVETVDVSLVDDVPTVLQVLHAIRANFTIGQAWMAEEFLRNNSEEVRAAFAQVLSGIALAYEPHVDFKRRVPQAIGLIRTGDTIQYANVIVESA
jgi:D-ribose pyranase